MLPTSLALLLILSNLRHTAASIKFRIIALRLNEKVISRTMLVINLPKLAKQKMILQHSRSGPTPTIPLMVNL